MRHLIWTFSNDVCVKYLDEMAIYFEFFDNNLVDSCGNIVLDLKQNYYYKSGRNMFPIINNKTWFGDYYNFDCKLVLTQSQKIELIKKVPANTKLFTSTDNADQLLINRMLNIAADYALDYYRSTRSYEQDKSYYLTKCNFNPSFADRFSHLDAVTQDEIIIELGGKVVKIAPILLDIIGEYLAVYELSYNLLEFNVRDGTLYLYTNGDWRILQWELEKNNREQKSKDISANDIRSINAAIEAEAAYVSARVESTANNTLFRERLNQMHNRLK